MSEELIVFVTAPDDESQAERIATSLVEERLAACVNVVRGVQSVYRWEGKVARDRESLLIIKTNVASYAGLERRVKTLHPYSTPEVIAIRIEAGSQEYLAWLRESVGRATS